MDRNVTMLLNSAAPTAVPPLDLADVRRRARRRRTVQATAVLGAVALAVPLALRAAPLTPPDVEFADAPAPQSAEVVIATFEQGGVSRELVAYESEDGLCVEDRNVVAPHNQGGGCGYDVPEHAIGLGVSGTQDGVVAAGPVVKSVADVRVELADGTTVDAGPIGEDAGFDVNFYLAVLPPGADVEAVVAFDAAGSVIERRATNAPGPSGGDAAPPELSFTANELGQADIDFKVEEAQPSALSRSSAVSAARQAAGRRAGRVLGASYGTVADGKASPRERQEAWVVVMAATKRANAIDKLPLLRIIAVIAEDGSATHLVGVTEAGATRLRVADAN